jgi:4-phospho-D-threonate 3-dehydrogenase / 4-phospho-D-erythronate 3-dehydrogenase
MNDVLELPLVALTMGDVAGIGPEVIIKAWADRRLHAIARPLVIGDPGVLERARSLARGGGVVRLQVVSSPEDADSTPGVIPCLAVDGIPGGLADVSLGHVDARAGRAAHEFLKTAASLAMAGRIDAITTLPLNKLALHRAGITHPGHTEILAEYCKTPDHAMMLYLENDESRARVPGAAGARASKGLGVVHVTLHVALKQVFELITTESVLSKIRLADRSMRPLTDGLPPRIAVASLNPHAGEDGLFGDEEISRIAPAVAAARGEGIDALGPFPNDTLFYHALSGQFDAVVAMYHDQGHIALKTVGFDRAVNVTLGLPIVRTSVAHGTAFDIAGKGLADPSSLIAAVRVAALLVAGRRREYGITGVR